VAVGGVGVGWCAEGITTYGNVGVLTFIGIVVYMGFLSQGCEFCVAGNAKRCKRANALQGQGRQLSVRAVKAAG
jgi:hypothetical protein